MKRNILFNDESEELVKELIKHHKLDVEYDEEMAFGIVVACAIKSYYNFQKTLHADLP